MVQEGHAVIQEEVPRGHPSLITTRFGTSLGSHKFRGTLPSEVCFVSGQVQRRLVLAQPGQLYRDIVRYGGYVPGRVCGTRALTRRRERLAALRDRVSCEQVGHIDQRLDY